MTDQTQEPTTERHICPTCGTRLAENATRCVVCGTVLQVAKGRNTPRARTQINLSLPIALLLIALFALLSAGLTYVATTLLGNRQSPLPSLTPTYTATQSLTPEPTATETIAPTPTPLPTLEYMIVGGDTCLGIAVTFDVSVQSIKILNPGLVCEFLVVGSTINIPQPTPTPSPEPTATLPPDEATLAACEKITYTVQADDTLGGIADNYNVNIQSIMNFNGMSRDTVYVGQVLIIPLCERRATPGPSPTATFPPPHPAPNLLLPQDGAPFTLAHDTVSLQWASVGELRDNEFYRVMVEDITEGSGTVRLDAYVTDTKYIVPASLRPTESVPHIMRWWVQVVRQVGTTVDGEPIYQSASAISVKRDFSWSGAVPAVTPTP
jgi:LysM repeat protein/ribosomal protein L40E